MALVVHSTHHWDLPSSPGPSLSTKSSAIYEQLDVTQRGFRLLNLRPGRRTDLIVCDLEVWYSDAGQCPQYEALSYVWGGSPGPETILLRGQSIPVTSNLASALRHLRSKDYHRVLWVDALSINQDDLEERNHQVRQMRSIYQLASRVVVWLGPADTESKKRAIDYMFRLANDRTLHWTSPGPGNILPDSTSIFVGGHILEFFWNPWWQRIWTVQEAAVASHLIYMLGNISIPADTFKKVAESCLSHVGKCCDAIYGHLDMSSDLLSRMKSVMEFEHLRERNRKADFLDVFHMNRHRKATNPRDMVYGLIGLTTGLDEGIIRYEVTIQATYEQSTLEIINKSGRLDVFSHILFANDGRTYWKKGTELLPSWVPDWNGGYDQKYLSSVTVRQKRLKLFHAAKNTRASVNRTAPGKLAVGGLDLLRVEHLGETKPLLYGTENIWSSWRNMAGIDSNPDQPYIAGGTLLNAYWRTLCYDSKLENAKDPLRRATVDDRIVHDGWWWNCVVDIHSKYKRERRSFRNQDYARFENTLQQLCSDRRFFTSSSGYIGIVPSNTIVGDRVCVLLGGKQPFVLRPCRNNTKGERSHSLEYTFVGDAYVHGLMDGEAIDMVDKGVLEMQTLVLR
ncbi:MAG: hypothetical protein Q9225_006509 [Loekoesia sp. 1 TL-2023]